MGRCFRQLQRDDRLKIYAWLQVKVPVAEIARRLNASRQTIYREIKRGSVNRKMKQWSEAPVNGRKKKRNTGHGFM